MWTLYVNRMLGGIQLQKLCTSAQWHKHAHGWTEELCCQKAISHAKLHDPRQLHVPSEIRSVVQERYFLSWESFIIPSYEKIMKKEYIMEEKWILHPHVIGYGYRQMQPFRALAGAWEFSIIYWWVCVVADESATHIVITRYSFTLICVAQGMSVPICVWRTELCLI